MTDLESVTERIEREEFARGHIDPGEEPSVPRPAATTILACARSDAAEYRVLLLRRPDTARFAAGAYVFAGGVIDAADAAASAVALLPEPLRREEAPAAVAALRELFEETGFLPSDRPVAADEAARARATLLRGDAGFAGAMEDLGASFHGLRAVYLSRWVTPTRFVWRYDTRFFLTLIQAASPPLPELTRELAGHVWITPGDAVREFTAGRLPMLFPTRRTLQMLAAERDLASLLVRSRDAKPRPIEPRLLVRGDTVRPVLPGDAGYDEAE